MAKGQKEATVLFTAEVSQFTKGITQINKSLSNLKSDLKACNADLKAKKTTYRDCWHERHARANATRLINIYCPIVDAYAV